jgi:nucleotide-binding universal stress UspA family protein
MRVVAAVDTSKSTESVLSVAVRVGAALGDDVEAIHVRVDKPAPTKMAEAAGVPLKTVDGEPVARIIEALSASDVALGVIGAKREAGDYRIAGSIAGAVIARSTSPLIVVGPSTRQPDHRLSRVLVPLDGTAEAANAVREVIGLFTAPDVDVVVHHVFDKKTVPACWDQAQHAQESWAREFLARWYNRPGAALTWQRGQASDAILDAATREDADLIALAWAQNTSLGHADIVKSALLRARVPVLLVPSLRAQEPPVKTPLRQGPPVQGLNP